MKKIKLLKQLRKELKNRYYSSLDYNLKLRIDKLTCAIIKLNNKELLKHN